MKDFDEVRNNLLSMLEELDDRLIKITEDVKHMDEPLDKDFAEQAVQTENNEVLDYLGNAARSEIDQIKQAIARIDAGDYGLCEMCGEPIGDGRLKALPFTKLCIRCAEQKEKR